MKIVHRLCFATLPICAAVLMIASFFSPPKSTSAAGITGLHVVGTQIENSAGQPVILRGVDKSGSEYSCQQGWGFFDGTNSQQAIDAMLDWGINAVRIPLNEDCWLGINGVSSTYSGANEQAAIAGYVSALEANGIVPILDLHWNAPGTTLASSQQVMADEDHSPAFWTSVATFFKNDSSVVFDLYNEPHDITWSCWLSGGSACVNPPFAIAGMQELLNDVRATGATNVVLAGGLAWSNDLSGWLANKPVDSAGELGASWHTYNFNACNTQSCWDAQVKPVAQTVPLIASEMGENDCAHGYIDQLMPYLDGLGAGYLAWSWNAAFSCSGGPSLIADVAGTPTGFGAGYLAHLQALGLAEGSTAAPTYRFDFEDGTTQGWTGCANTTARAYSGTHSCATTVSGAGYPLATGSVSNVSPGQVVTFHIYATTASPPHIIPKVRDSSGVWYDDGHTYALTSGAWTTITWTVPTTAPNVAKIGFQVQNGAGWLGEVDNDATNF